MPEIDVSPFKILGVQLEAFTRAFIQLAPNIIAAFLFLVVTWLLAKGARALVSGIFKSTGSRPALKEALMAVATTLIWLIGVLIAAMIALPGLTPANAIAGLGIGSIAVGLAFKDIFENFLAGILILLRKPMRIGDFIECDGVDGHVRKITIRDTYVRRTDGALVLMPNALIYKNPTRVLTDWDKRRVELTVGIAYSEDVGEGRRVITKAVEGLSTLMPDTPVQVFAKEFNSSSIDYQVAWWTGSEPVAVRRSRDEAVEAIKKALDGAGIEIPFPYRTLTFKEPLPIRRATNTQNAARANGGDMARAQSASFPRGA